MGVAVGVVAEDCGWVTRPEFPVGKDGVGGPGTGSFWADAVVGAAAVVGAVGCVVGAGSTRIDSMRTFCPEAGVHVSDSVPKAAGLPLASSAVMWSVDPPMVIFATPGRVKVSEGKLPVATSVREPDAGSFVGGTVNGSVRWMSLWGAVTVTDPSPFTLTESMP